MLGPGKYDALCTEARTKAKAMGAIMIIIDGEHGSGFSVQAPGLLMHTLPEILESVAASLRADRGHIVQEGNA